MKYRCGHGEALSAANEAIALRVPRLGRKVQSFAPGDVFNSDEFGLFYRQPVGWSFSSATVSGVEQDKSRFTFMA